MPSSNGGTGTTDGTDDAVALMEKAIDAVFTLKRKVREADERARQHQEETRVRVVSSPDTRTCGCSWFIRCMKDDVMSG